MRRQLTVGQRKQRRIKRVKIMLIVAIFIAFVAMLITSGRISAAPLVGKEQATEIQMILVHHGYALKVDGEYGPITEKAVRHWQKSNRLLPDGIPGPITMRSLRQSIDGPANPSVLPAKRLNPTGLNGLPIFPGGSDACSEMIFYMEQAGLPERFNDSGRHQQWVKSDGIGWRESKCNNLALNACCGGYWQNYLSSHLSKQSQYRNRIINECQVTKMSDIVGDTPTQKQRSACVTKVVYDISGLSPWD